MINQFLFLFFLEVLGLSFMVLFKKNLDRAYLYLLSFPMGVSLWAFLILILLGAGVPVRRGAVLTASFLMLGTFFLMDLKKKDSRFSSFPGNHLLPKIHQEKAPSIRKLAVRTAQR